MKLIGNTTPELQRQNKRALIMSLSALALLFLFGAGVILGGLITGIGLFFVMFLVCIRRPGLLQWAKNHPLFTELSTTLGSFALFSVFAEGTVTALVASVVTCLCVSAALGFTYLSDLLRGLVGAKKVGEVVLERGTQTIMECGDTARRKISKHAKAIRLALKKKESGNPAI